MKKLLQLFIKYREKKLLQKCYTNIDELPVFYWRKIHETKNLSFLIRSDIISLNKKLPKGIELLILAQLWERIYDQYISEFGFSEEFLEIHRKKKEIAHYRLRMVAENNKSLQNFVNMAQNELDAMIKAQGTGGNYFETKAFVESVMRVPIDDLKTSVSEFYFKLKLAEKKISNGRATD